MGDRKGQISRSKVVVMLKTQSHRAYDRQMLEWWANRRTIVRLVSQVVRLVAEVMGDGKGQISRNKVYGHVQNFKPASPNRKQPHDLSCHWSCHLTIGGTTNRLLTYTIKCGDVSGVQVIPHTAPDAIYRTIDRRGPRLNVRSIVYGYH